MKTKQYMVHIYILLWIYLYGKQYDKHMIMYGKPNQHFSLRMVDDHMVYIENQLYIGR